MIVCGRRVREWKPGRTDSLELGICNPNEIHWAYIDSTSRNGSGGGSRVMQMQEWCIC